MLKVCEEVFGDLERFGERVSGEIEPLGRQAELEPPFIRYIPSSPSLHLSNSASFSHTPTACRKYDAWGEKVDELVTSSAWQKLHDIAAEEGLVAIAYERKHGQWRYVQYSLYLLSLSLSLTNISCSS